MGSFWANLEKNIFLFHEKNENRNLKKEGSLLDSNLEDVAAFWLRLQFEMELVICDPFHKCK